MRHTTLRLRSPSRQGDLMMRFDPACEISKKYVPRFGEVLGRKLWPLDAKGLCDEARRRAGFSDFGDAGVESRLAVLVKSLDRDASLRPRGRLLARIHLGDLLEKRLRLEQLWQQSDCADGEVIERPIFITGMPRSGSTFLHELLARDARNRAPLVWEVMSPLPAAERSRIWRAAACLWWFRRMAPAADSVHPIRARTPHECVAIHSYTLLSREFTTTFRVSGYENFLDRTDYTPAYAWEKKFLQHLQLKRPRKRWILKAPDHVYGLAALMRVFPDAMVIQTHRDPLEVLESSSRLTEVVQRIFARRQDRRELAIREARILADGMDRITRFRETHPELASRFVDVNYNDIVSDPTATIRQLYRQLDLPLAHPTLELIRNLAARRSRYGRPRKKSTLLDFGIDLKSEARRFAPYCTRFGIRSMGRSDA
jgi:hypothetical protein